ncbi:MAG: Tol-Pal system beta propeller repeat protein TolB [Paracoccaceae bacterium]
MRPVRYAAAICAAIAVVAGASAALAQSKPLRIEITEGVIEPLPFAIPTFVAEPGTTRDLASNVSRVVSADLVGSGLFRRIPAAAHIDRITSFNAPVEFANWKAINAQALITGSVANAGGGRVVVQFRLWDVFAQQQIGDGVQYVAPLRNWRRIAHKVADTVYSRLTGEDGYFDSRVVFVSERGRKGNRTKQLAMMDQDGANVKMLTGSENLVLAPRFSPNARQVLYTSYETGVPRVYMLDVDSGQRSALSDLPGMTFAPRFSPDGKQVAYSATDATGNTDLYVQTLSNGRTRRLTRSAAIDSAPSFSPDGRQIVFESDRGGSQQIYVMPAGGGPARRISFGAGHYGTPVWSPRGDLIAFTKIVGGRFHVGVMRLDGSEERLLTSSFHDEGPTWSPNGRVLMFFRESPGSSGAPALYSVDVTGRNLRKVPTPGFASDPAWSKLLP